MTKLRINLNNPTQDGWIEVDLTDVRISLSAETIAELASCLRDLCREQREEEKRYTEIIDSSVF